MPAFITDEDYDGQNALYKNAGDWTEAEFRWSMRFSKGSGVSNSCTYVELGSLYYLEFQQGDWGDEGFLAGDNIIIDFTLYIGPPGGINIVLNATVDYVDGTILYLTAPLALGGGITFPTDGLVSGVLVIADKLPAALEWQFNLTPNGSALLNSMLDNQLNRFEIQDAASLGVGVPTPMTQLTNRSGGWLKDVEVTYVGAPGDYMRDFLITYKFIQWGIIRDGQEPPAYYDASDHLAPIGKIRNFAQYGNPNGVVEATSDNLEANTGFFDENYNGGINNYTSVSTDWFDSLGNPIDGPDYSGPSTFIAIVDAPNQNNPNSTYRLGIAFRPIDGSQYQNLPTNAGQNLMINAPETDFIADGVTVPGPFLGEQNDDGAQWDFENLTFTLTGPNTLQITGQLTPNAACIPYFVNFPDGERKTTLWVSLGNYNLSPILDDRVSLRLWDADNIDAPTIGVQIPNVVDEFLLDHAQIDVTTPEPQTTTEDDVLYRSRFRAIDNVLYEGMRVRIWAYNTITEDEFTLENQFFSFASVPFINGQFQPDIDQSRGFNLPPTTDRNAIRIFRDPTLDIPGQYGIVVEYGWLNDWRYWLEQSNVDNAFFDPTENFNGKNKNWQRFYVPPEWVLRVSYYTQVDGVQDFNHFQFGDRPYEDDPDVSTTWDITVPSTGQNPTNLIANEIHEVLATLTWAAGSYTNPWAEITIEDFEAGNRWVISSVLDQGGIASNPLKPIAGVSLLDLQLPAANIAELRCIIDTNVVTANKVCVSARIYSEDVPIYEYMLDVTKEAVVAYALRKMSTNAVYPDASPCIRVRRSHDNAELDIGFNNNVVDQVALLDHVTEGGTHPSSDGYVTIWYDQSGNNNHCLQVSAALQAKIVTGGVVETDPDNGFPALLFSGTQYYGPTLSFANTQLCYQHFIFNRATSGTTSIGLSVSGTRPYPFYWFTDDGQYTDFGTTVNHDAGQTQTGDFLSTVLRDISNNVKHWENGSPMTTVAQSGTSGIYQRLGGRSATQNHNGHMQEVMYFNTDKEASRTTYETNANNFYGIW